VAKCQPNAVSGMSNPIDALIPKRQLRERTERKNPRSGQQSGNRRGAMNSFKNPKVIGDDQKRKGKHNPECDWNSKVPTADGWAHDCHGAQDHQSFVRSGVAPCEESPRDQKNE